MTAYQFQLPGAERLWNKASPKGEANLGAFAWREAPAALDKAWAKAIKGKDEGAATQLLAVCLGAADTQSAYRSRRLQLGDKLGRPPGIAVWVNKGGWAEEIVETSRPAAASSAATCQYCDEPLAHGHFGTCARHTPVSEDQAWSETLIRSRMRELLAWEKKHKKPDETANEFFRRVARFGWKKWKAKHGM